jgi:hypothetical protein
MMRSLSGTRGIAAGSAVASERSPVTNISALRPGITVEDMEQAVRESWERVSGAPLEEYGMEGAFGDPEFSGIVEEMRGWEWRFGSTPAFDASLGGLPVRVERGMVAAAGGAARFDPCNAGPAADAGYGGS